MQIPKTKKGIHSKISKYEKILKDEKKKFGFFHDRRGIRYDIGPMYLLADEVDLALQSF